MATGTVVKGAHTYDLLKYLYDHKGEWIFASSIYGKDRVFPRKLDYTPNTLFKKGLIDKKLEDGRSKLKIIQRGIIVIEELEKSARQEVIPEKKAIAEAIPISKPVEITPKPQRVSSLDLYQIKATLSYSEKEILKTLFYEKAFSTQKAKDQAFIEKQVNIEGQIANSLLTKLINTQLLIKTIKSEFYLTQNGIKLTESLILKGLEFVDDSLESFILNPIGRKVLHLIEIGQTANTIAESIGYYVEELFQENNYRLVSEIDYVVHKVYQTLDRLRQYDVIELRYHPNLEGSAKIIRIINPSILELLRHIAVLVEFIPTLFAEDNTHISFLRSLINPELNREKIQLFQELVPFPERFRGVVAYAERLAYWLDPIENLEEKQKEWKNIALKENGGKHYFMLKKKGS